MLLYPMIDDVFVVCCFVRGDFIFFFGRKVQSKGGRIDCRMYGFYWLVFLATTDVLTPSVRDAAASDECMPHLS